VAERIRLACLLAGSPYKCMRDLRAPPPSSSNITIMPLTRVNQMHAAMEARPLIVLSPRLDLECAREKCASTDVSRPILFLLENSERNIKRREKTHEK